MKTRVKMALVGCGYWGSNILRNLARHPQCDLVGFCDVKEVNLSNAVALYGQAAPYSSFANMLSELKPEAVVVSTPPDSHCRLAVEALRAGAHVLIEKPMARSSEECDLILAEAQLAGRRVMIDNTLLFYPPMVHLIEMIKRGDLGRLLYYDSVRINLGGFQPQANVLWDLAPHELSILDLLTNHEAPKEVIAIGNKHFGSATESICYLNLKYSHNFNAHLHLNWSAPVKTRRLLVAGDRKMAELDDGVLVDKLRIYDKSVTIDEHQRASYHSGEMIVPVLAQNEALFEMISEFIGAIVEKREPSSNGLSGARVVRMLEAATASLAGNGKPIPF